MKKIRCRENSRQRRLIHIVKSGFLDEGLGGILLHGFNAVQAAGKSLVAFAGGDDLTIGGLQIKLHAGVGLANHKFTRGEPPERNFFKGVVFSLLDEYRNFKNKLKKRVI